MEKEWSLQSVLDVLASNLFIYCINHLKPPFVQRKTLSSEAQQTFKDEFMHELETLANVMSHKTKTCFSCNLGKIRGRGNSKPTIAYSKSCAMSAVLSKLPKLEEGEFYFFLDSTTLWFEFVDYKNYRLTQVSPWISNLM